MSFQLGNIQTFTSSGTWYKDANATFVSITVIGGGGGGGFGGSYNPGATGGSGGGGGGSAAPTQSTNYTTNIPEYAKPDVENMLNATQAQIYNPSMGGFNPYVPYSTNPADYVAGFSPLQQQAYQMAPDAAFSGASTIGSGAQLAGLSGTTSAPSIINQYMNPYTNTVVNEMGRLQQQNIQRNVIPALKAAGAAAQSQMAPFSRIGQPMQEGLGGWVNQKMGQLASKIGAGIVSKLAVP